jgi:uncharacterized protein (TIGR03437 family)
VAGFSGDGGPATKAQVNLPGGLAVDAAGNLYFADQYNLRVRKILADGVITTIAGGGTIFPADGVPAAQSELYYPAGVALGPDGSIYIAAGYIQKISSDGMISILAGNGYESYSGDNGPALNAQLFVPTDLALDGRGNVYIADALNHAIRRVDASGIITTFAGTGSCGSGGDGGPASRASLCSPSGVTTDSAGDVFIADNRNNRVRMISPTGTITTVAGNGQPGFSGDGGPAAQAGLSLPWSVAVDAAGNLFIADYGNNRIRKVSNGTITTVAGTGIRGFSGDGGPAAAAEISHPWSLALGPAGDLYFAEFINLRVRRVSSTGIISTVAGGNGNGQYPGDGALAANAGIPMPWGVAADSAGSLYISANEGKIYKVSESGIITTLTGYGGVLTAPVASDGAPAATAYLGLQLAGLRVDPAGRIFVADDVNSVRILQPVNQSVLIGAVVDAASQSAIALSPGKIAVIYGTGMGPAKLVSNQPLNGAFSTSVAGTTVSINGMAAPVLYASATQVAVVTPYGISGANAQVQVSYQGATSPAVTLPVAASAPSLFSSNGTGAGQAAAVNGDGSINDAAHPVKVGGYISLYATGEGQTTPQGADGKLAPLAPPFPQPQLSPSVTVGGLPAAVLYAGAAPGEVAGLMQVVIQIPSGVQPGGYVPVTLQVGTASTVDGAAWIAVSN